MTSETLQCSHFGRCGGCSRLDQPIELQLEDKRDAAMAQLAPFLDGIEPAITLPPRPPRYDRISITYPVQPRRRGPMAGIYRRGTHQVEPIRDCRIQHRALTTFGARANDVLHRVGVEAYDERTGKGAVRAIRARVLPGSNELLVGAVVNTMRFNGRDAMFDGLWDAAHDLRGDQGQALKPVGAVCNLNDKPGNTLLGAENTAFYGRDWQEHVVQPDLRFRVSFASFYQLHRHADAVLFRPAMAMLGGDGELRGGLLSGLRIVDGYGGVGSFALRLLAAGAGHVTLIEASPGACRDARHNLSHNESTSADRPEGSWQDRWEVREQPFGSQPLPECDVLVVDPPRKGLGQEGAAAVLTAMPPKVLLISCAIGSLARDLEQLSPHYRVAALRLCDLFPHTEHIEAVTLLERRDS
ncbi:MAG: class I SAM-dependent RNA methyltransferase [Planctomycetota bacterium]